MIIHDASNVTSPAPRAKSGLAVTEILRGLEKCDWFLLVASENSAKSEWVRDEVNWAIFYRPTKIVTVIMNDCHLWDFHIRIPRLQYLDFRQNVELGKSELVNVFRQ